jgi:hypothetical protein
MDYELGIIRNPYFWGGVREPPGGPRSGGEAMSEAKPVRWRPCEAGARPNNS